MSGEQHQGGGGYTQALSTRVSSGQAALPYLVVVHGEAEVTAGNGQAIQGNADH